jgi:SAM-dependent methyltransferase
MMETNGADQAAIAGEIVCRGCGERGAKRLFSLGAVPLVNAFVTREEIQGEAKHELDLVYCPSCTLVQLGTVVPPEDLFSHYLHLSSASQSNIKHLEDVANAVRGRLRVGGGTRILEIGSNDGTLLSRFLADGARLLGVDPARNLLPLSKERGVETIVALFSERLAEEIAQRHGQFDGILGLNVVAHTPYVMPLLRGVQRLLAPQGTFMMEAAYVLPTILQGEFDTIYHEHFSCFSLHALVSAFARAGLVAVDVERIPTQGGSLRVFAQRAEDAPAPRESVARVLREESELGVTDPSVYEAVASKVARFKHQLRGVVNELQRAHGPLIGLGAPARGVVILNTCELGPGELAFVIDDTALKQGRYVPGVHVPVRGWESLGDAEHHGDRAFLMLSWNYRDEILGKLRRHVASARVIVPFPRLEIVDVVGAG